MATPRHRSTAVAAPVTNGVLTHQLASGSTNSAPNIGIPSLTYKQVTEWQSSKTMDDWVTPNFRKIIARGGIVNNPMLSTTVYEERNDLTYNRQKIYHRSNSDQWEGFVTSGSNWYSGFLDTMLPDAPALSTLETLKDLAVRQAHAKIELSQAMLLASLGEGRETIASMVAILKRATKIARAIRRLNIKALRRELSRKELADRYMEFRYALRPLVYDAKQVVAALSGDELPDVGRQTFRGYKEDFGSTVENGVLLYSDAGTRVYGRQEASTVFQVRAGVLTTIEAISKLNVWGLDSIAESAWELMPYSFILDWFFDIGETLASWTPEMGVKKLASWVVTEVTTTQMVRVTSAENILPSGATVWSDFFTLSGYHSKVTTVKTRTPDPSLPILPTFRLKLDLLKLLDLVIIGRKAARL
jgi:hypothetical protein